MQKFKKFVALALATTMVFGASLTAFAADGDTTGSATQTGEGTSEGTVDKQHINVVLPVVPEGSTPFAFTVDPERLVTATDGARYSEEFSEDAKTNGVYFLTADGYDSTSDTLQVINKSSDAIMLSVKVKATAAESDPITLGTTSSTEVADTASLYLALNVGDTEQAVSTTEATVTKKVAGVADNYEVTYDEEDGYAFTVKSTADTWKAMNISMTGAVTQSSAKNVNPPTLTVTWSFALPATDDEKAADVATDAVNYSTTPTVASASASSVVVGGNVNILLPTGVTITEIQKTKADGTYNTLPTDYYTLEDIANGKKLTINGNLLTNLPAATTIKVVLSDGDPIVISILSE